MIHICEEGYTHEGYTHVRESTHEGKYRLHTRERVHTHIEEVLTCEGVLK